MNAEISRELLAKKKELSILLKELVAKKTVNPPGSESLAASVLQKYFKKYKIKTTLFEKEKNRTNLVASIGKGKPELMIALHSDVVPAGNGWTTDPFKAVQKKGKIYGRGVADNKGPLAATAVLLAVLKRHEKKLKGRISLLAAADEEKGSRLGVQFLLNEKKISPDFVVVPDVFTENKKISVAEKGLLHLKAISLGRQAHGSEPEKGENAILKMAAFLCKAKKTGIPRAKSKYFEKATINFGTINGGEAINIVPAYCEAKIDVRFLPSQKPSEILARIKKIAKKHDVRISVIDCQMPFEIRASNPLVMAIQESVKKVYGKNAKLCGISGTTVAKKFLEKRIIAVGFGPGKMVAHQSNESIEISQLLEFAQIMAMVSAILFFKE
ncbi:MAG: M20 family metallopeptidase [Candidatus Diapherotrites archaeon]